MTIVAAPLVLAIAACGAFVLRKRLNIVGPFALVAIAAAFALVILSPPDATGTILDLDLREKRKQPRLDFHQRFSHDFGGQPPQDRLTCGVDVIHAHRKTRGYRP